MFVNICLLIVANWIFFKNELDDAVLQWNVHKMQKYGNSRASSDRPIIIMFEMSSVFETYNYLSQVSSK